MKKMLLIITLMLGFVLIGCSNQTEYTVIKTLGIEGFERLTIDFEYDSDKNCVTVNATDGEYSSSLLIFVNSDGAITSIYSLDNSGSQDTWFDEKAAGYPITGYNDAGMIESVEYDKVTATFLYNNFIDNELISIEYRETNPWSDDDDIHKFTAADFEEYEITKHTKTKNPSFKMFNNTLWFFSMMDALDAVYYE